MLPLLVLALSADARTVPLGAGLLVDQWTTSDGLPLDHTVDVAVTPDGFAWVATFEGVVRFDGAQFAPMDDAWIAALGTRRIARVATDPHDGALWLLAEDGGVARYHEGAFRVWHDARDLRGTTTAEWDFDDEGGWLWTGAGLYRLADAPRRVEWPENQGAIAGFAPTPGGALLAAETGIFWRRAGLPTKRLGAAEGVDGPVGWLEAQPDGTPVARIGDTLRVWDGAAFVAAAEGTWPCQGRQMRASHVCAPRGAPDSPWRVTERAVMYDGRDVWPLHAPAEDPVLDAAGDLWVPTRADGLLRFRSSVVRHVPTDEADARVDRLWIDTTDRLWARLAKDWRWRVYTAADRAAGRSGAAVTAPTFGWVFERSPAELVSFRRGLARAFRIDGQALADAVDRAVPVEAQYVDVLRTDGTRVFGGDDGLSTLVDGIPTPVALTGAPLGRVRALATLDDGLLAAGTQGDGLLVVDTSWAARIVGGAGDRLVRSFRHLRRRGDVLWGSTEEEGLCAIVPKPDVPGAAAWDDATWRCLRPGGTGSSGFATVRGVHASEDDGAGHTWLSSNTGLWVGRTDALDAFARGEAPAPTLLRLGVDAGMRKAEANGPYGGVVARDAAGVLWFPTQDGVVGVDPARFTLPAAPRVHPPAWYRVRPRSGDAVADRILLPSSAAAPTGSRPSSRRREVGARLGVVAVMVLAGCGADTTITKRNDAPLATISTPISGEEIPEGELVTLAGLITDLDDTDLVAVCRRSCRRPA